MNKRLTHAIETFCDVAEYLNNEIRKNGEIQKNNHKLWNNYLHKFTNDDWAEICMVIDNLNETQHIKLKHIEHFDEVVNQIYRLGKQYDNVMDIRTRGGYINNKPMAWKGIHYVREIYNDICDIYLPNTNESKDTHFDTMFESQ